MEAIGSGAFSVVWRGEDVRSNTTAAIKVFRPLEFPEADRAEAAVRFYEGAAAMRKLAQSAHVVKLYDGPHFSSGYLWFSMEYMPDGDLSKSLKQGSLTLKNKFQIIDDLISALEDAHREKIRHRDLRPPNILIKRTGSDLHAILADFDIAYYDHILRPRDSTVAPRSIGRYTPPEIFVASSAHMKQLGRRYSNDLYSLCIVAFDVFSGEEQSLPESRSQEDFERFLLLAKDLDARTRFRVANLCAKGLGLRSQTQRLNTIAEAKETWSSLRDLPVWRIQLTRVVRSRLGSTAATVLVFMSFVALALYSLYSMRYVSRPADKTINLIRSQPRLEAPAGTTPDIVSLADDAGMASTIPSTTPSSSASLVSVTTSKKCMLPEFHGGAAPRYLAMSDSEKGAVDLKQQLMNLFQKDPNGRVWSTALQIYPDKRPSGRRKWVVGAYLMDPDDANLLCDWLTRCKGWSSLCTSKYPLP